MIKNMEFSSFVHIFAPKIPCTVANKLINIRFNTSPVLDD